MLGVHIGVYFNAVMFLGLVYAVLHEARSCTKHASS